MTAFCVFASTAKGACGSSMTQKSAVAWPQEQMLAARALASLPPAKKVDASSNGKDTTIVGLWKVAGSRMTPGARGDP